MQYNGKGADAMLNAQLLSYDFRCRSIFMCKKLSGSTVVIAVLLCLASTTNFAFAGDFDGSQPLAGTTGKIVEINAYRINDDVDPDTVGLPKKFLIDFKAGMLRPSKDSLVRRTIAINRVEHVENMMVLQGVDKGVEGVNDGLAWSLSISKKDGKAVLSASGGGVAYAVFGVCTPVKDQP